MDYNTALHHAQEIYKLLEPHCERVEIAGSIRRKKQVNIKDIEIVCIPKTDSLNSSLFGDPVAVRAPGFTRALEHFKLEKGDTKTGKYCVYKIAEGVKLDLFIANPENWGYILAIRTGSSEFSKAMAVRWKQKGLQGRKGMLYWIASDTAMPVREEKDLFQLLDLEYVKPEFRELKKI